MSALGSTLPTHSRVQSQPLPSQPLISHLGLSSSPPIATKTLAKRPRAPSDPFLDTPPLSRSLATTSSASQIGDLPGTPDDASVNVTLTDDVLLNASPSRRGVFPEIEAQSRIWTAPDLTNPEYASLLRLFPSFISSKPLQRFPAPPKRKQDIEEGEEQTEEPFEIRFGTGMIRLGGPYRTGPWRGGWWARFSLWCKTLFC